MQNILLEFTKASRSMHMETMLRNIIISLQFRKIRCFLSYNQGYRKSGKSKKNNYIIICYQNNFLHILVYVVLSHGQ